MNHLGGLGRAQNSNDIFTGTRVGDTVLFSSRPAESIHIGTDRNAAAALTITAQSVQVRQNIAPAPDATTPCDLGTPTDVFHALHLGDVSNPNDRVTLQTTGTPYMQFQQRSLTYNLNSLTLMGQTPQEPFVSASGYGEHSLAIGALGGLYAWGDNSAGQLGTGNTTRQLVPVPVDMTGALFGKKIKMIRVGGGFTVALDTVGNVYSWGANFFGQLGNGSLSARTVPGLVNSGALAEKIITAIAVGGRHVLALDSNGALYAWGANHSGQLGIGSNTLISSVPVAVNMSGVLAGKTIVAITAGPNYNLVLDSNGKIYGWGLNEGGQLGDGTLTKRTSPVECTLCTATGLTFMTVTAQFLSACAIDSRGKVYEWGGNYGTAIPPYEVAGALSGKTVTAIASGPNHSAALGSDRRVYTWGNNDAGQLGIGIASNASSSPTPVLVPGLENIVSIATGLDFTLAQDEVGNVHAWGLNYNGQLGIGIQSFNNPSPVLTLIPESEKRLVANTQAPTLTPVANASLEGSLLPASNLLYNVGGSNQRFKSLHVQSAHLNAITLSPTHAPWAGAAQLSISAPRTFTLMNQQRRPNPAGTNAVGNSGCYGESSFVISANGTIYAWGKNLRGQLSDTVGTTAVSVSTPTPIYIFAKDDNVPIIQIASSATHTVALDAQGIVYTWGGNASGQLGNGTTTASTDSMPTPMPVGGVLAGRPIVQIAAGVDHTVALDEKGRVYTWGGNSNGQLGLEGGDAIPMSLLPVEVTLLAGRRIVQIAAGAAFTLALDDQSNIYAWGQNDLGQLGKGTVTIGLSLADFTPQRINSSVLADARPIAAIAAGGSFAFAVDTQGRLYSWGDNRFGQLGQNISYEIMSENPSPSPVYTGGALFTAAPITAIAANFASALALDANGVVYAWGDNGRGQLGITSTPEWAPQRVLTLPDPITTPITSIAANGAFFMAYASKTSDLFMWGQNYYGQLGTTTNMNSTTSVTVPTPITSIPLNERTSDAPAAPNTDAVTLSTNADVFRVSGPLKAALQLGEAQIEHTMVVKDILAPTTTRLATLMGLRVPVGAAAAATAGNSGQSYHTYVIGASGALYGWGDNWNGKLADGTNAQQNTPVVIPLTGVLTSSARLATVIAGFEYSLILDTNGRLYSAGDNGNGQLGDGTTTSRNTFAPVQGPLASTSVISVSAGSQHVVAVASNGTVYTWGWNNYYQLGVGSYTQYTLPTPIDTNPATSALAGKTVVAVAAGSIHTLALDSNGAVYAWGDGGRIGDGTPNPRASPTEVSFPPNTTIVAIAAGSDHSLALDSTGQVWGWGLNYYGCVGNGTNTDVLAPTPVVNTAFNGRSIAAIAAGGSHSLALDGNGAVYAWGNNSRGQLGIGNPPPSVNAPTPVNTGGALANKTIVQIAVGMQHSMAIDSNGEVYAWGSDELGQLGNDQYTNNAITPVALTATFPSNEKSAQVPIGPTTAIQPALTLSAHLQPASNLAYDLGSATHRFRDLYLSGNTIDLGGIKISKTANNTVEFRDATTNQMRPLTVNQVVLGGTSSSIITTTNPVDSSSTVVGATSLANLDASVITSGVFSTARLPAATSTTPGIVQLNNTVISSATNVAATANAAKVAYDAATSASNIATSANNLAFTASNIAMSGSNLAATACNLAISASNLAAAKVSRSGDTMTGTLTVPTLIATTAIQGPINATNITTGTLSSNVLPNTTVTPSTYGTATTIPTLTIDAMGRITNATPTPIQVATTATPGIVQLNDTTTSTSTTQAATANATKQAYALATTASNIATSASNLALTASNIATSASNLANTRVSKGGDTMTGTLTVPTLIATTAIQGDGAQIINLNATNIASGTLATARLPDSGATAGAYGSTTAVPVLTIDAKGRITNATTAAISATPPAASTTQAGIVQLNDTVTSTSTTQAATANAVKQAYDASVARVAKAGDTMTGKLQVLTGGVAPPANGAAGGIGDRIVLWPGAADSIPFSLGIDGGTLWYGAPASCTHRWHVGSTTAMSLTGSATSSTLNLGASSFTYDTTNNAVTLRYNNAPARFVAGELQLGTETDGMRIKFDTTTKNIISTPTFTEWVLGAPTSVLPNYPSVIQVPLGSTSTMFPLPLHDSLIPLSWTVVQNPGIVGMTVSNNNLLYVPKGDPLVTGKFDNIWSSSPSSVLATYAGITGLQMQSNLGFGPRQFTVQYKPRYFTFTTAGASRNVGPTPSQLQSAYGPLYLGDEMFSTGRISSTSTTYQGVQIFVTPYTGTYRITCYGGSSHDVYDGSSPVGQGGGAVVQADFTLTQGNILYIVVGQQSQFETDRSSRPIIAGGGGGTFVARGNSPGLLLLAAGGGGGAVHYMQPSQANSTIISPVGSVPSSPANGGKGYDLTFMNGTYTTYTGFFSEQLKYWSGYGGGGPIVNAVGSDGFGQAIWNSGGGGGFIGGQRGIDGLEGMAGTSYIGSSGTNGAHIGLNYGNGKVVIERIS